MKQDSKEEQADLELIEPGSDVEEGGLDLSVPFKPISAYVADRHEMLDQCFHVLGENKLQKMLPDELKVILGSEIQGVACKGLEPGGGPCVRGVGCAKWLGLT